MAFSVSRAQWFEAAKNGDWNALERWHRLGVLKKQRFDPQKVTARPGEGRPTLARLVNGDNPGDLDALDTALFNYHPAYAIRLLELERFPPLAEPILLTPLERVASMPNTEPQHIECLVGLLQEQGHDLNGGWMQRSPLECAIQSSGGAARVAVLLRMGADPAQGKHGNVIHTAVKTLLAHERYSLDILRVLLDAGVDPDARSHEGGLESTPLMQLTASWTKLSDRYRDVMAMLLEAGANPDLALPLEKHEPDKLMTAEDLITSPVIREVFRGELAKARARTLDSRLGGVGTAARRSSARL